MIDHRWRYQIKMSIKHFESLRLSSLVDFFCALWGQVTRNIQALYFLLLGPRVHRNSTKEDKKRLKMFYWYLNLIAPSMIYHVLCIPFLSTKVKFNEILSRWEVYLHTHLLFSCKIFLNWIKVPILLQNVNYMCAAQCTPYYEKQCTFSTLIYDKHAVASRYWLLFIFFSAMLSMK